MENFETIGHTPESEFEREKSEFIERVEKLIETGQVGVLFSGVIIDGFKIGEREIENRAGSYQSLDIAGRFKEVEGSWLQQTNDDSRKWEVSNSIESILRAQGDSDISKVDEVILVNEPTISKVEGTRTELRKEKGFLGMKKRISVQLPKRVEAPLLLRDSFEKGSSEKALFVSLIHKGIRREPTGRPYRNRYVLALPESVVSEIFGTKEQPGGLLKKHPDLIRKLLERTTPELMADAKPQERESRTPIPKTRRVFVGAPNFSSESPSLAEVTQKLQRGITSERIVEYQLD